MKSSAAVDTTATPPAAAREMDSRCRRCARKVKNAIKDAVGKVAVLLAERAEGRKSKNRRGQSAGGDAPMVLVELRCDDDDDSCAGATIADLLDGFLRGAGECASALLEQMRMMKLPALLDTSCGDCDFDFDC